MQPAQAAETTIGVCQTPTTAARVFSRDGQLNMRVYDRTRKAVWLNSPVTTTVNPGVVTFQNTRGEQAVKTSFSRNSLADCSIMIGDQLQAGRVIQGGGDSVATITLGVCVTSRDAARIYDESGKLKMRVFDRVKNVFWLDEPAASIAKADGVEYRNTAGEVIIRTNFNRSTLTDCSIIVGSDLEAGRAMQGSMGAP